MTSKTIDNIITTCVFLLFVSGISFAFYTCTHQYKDAEYVTDVKIRNEIVRDEQSGRSTYEAFYFICTDKDRIYRISTREFKDYPMTLPNDSFRVKIHRGIPTKWANNTKDTVIFGATVIKKL